MLNTVAEPQLALARALDDDTVPLSHDLAGLRRIARHLAAVPDPQIDPVFASRLEAWLLSTRTEGVPAQAVAVLPRASLAPEPSSDSQNAPAAIVSLPRRRFVVRRSVVAAVAAAMLLALPVAASASALPGSPLYGLKRAIERSELVLSRGHVADGFVHLRHGERRFREVEQLIALSRTRYVPETLERMDASLLAGTASILHHTKDAATLRRLEAALRRTNAGLASLLPDAPAGVQADIIRSLASGRILTSRVEQALGDERAAGGSPASGVGDSTAAGVLPLVPMPPIGRNDVEGSGTSTTPRVPDDTDPSGHDSSDTAASCRQRSYVGPGSGSVHDTCSVSASVSADLDATLRELP